MVYRSEVKGAVAIMLPQPTQGAFGGELPFPRLILFHHPRHLQAFSSPGHGHVKQPPGLPQGPLIGRGFQSLIEDALLLLRYRHGSGR